jgi:hypothetical protein
MKFQTKALFLLISIIAIKSEVVCSEDELVKELLEDLADNGIFLNNCLGKLDCLRESVPVPGETQDQAARRKAAEWNGDCSFESESDSI